MDNLESLSNADLRAECLKFGLPNVPVTDSSRNVLIKKLRSVASNSGAQTKSARRETIHVSATSTVKTVKESVDPSANRANNRRTIGATAPALDVSRRDLQAEKIVAAAAPSIRNEIHAVQEKAPVLEKPKAVVVAPADTAVGPAPISNRRRSMREQNIDSITTVLEGKDLIVIESDEEDDMLAELATKAEERNKATLNRREAERPTRAASLSKSATVSASYVEAPRAASKLPIREYDNVKSLYGTRKLPPSESRSQFTQPAAKPTLYTSRPAPRYSSAQPPSYSSAQPPSSSRYSSAHEQYASTFYSPSMRRSTPAAASTLLSKLYYNENSDDPDVNEEEDNFQTPFLSNFARNLERLKVEPTGRIGGTPLSATGDIGGDIAMRRHKRNTLYNARAKGGAKPLIVLLHELWVELDRKYNLKRTFVLLLSILIVIFLYVLFSP